MGQVGPSLGRRAGKLFCQHRGAYAPAARRVERVLDGDVIVDDDRRDLDALVGRILRGELEVEYVACVVLDNVDHPGAAVDGFGGGEHLPGYGRGEHLTRGRRGEHTEPHKTAVQGLVPRPAA